MSTRDWIQRTLLRPRLPSLDVALLTNRGLHFATARLSFVYLRALLRTAVHAAELIFMSRSFPLEFAAPLFAMRAVFGIGSSMSWGLFEGVRRRVREEKSALKPERARLAIEAWSSIVGSLGLAGLGASIAWTLDDRPMEWAPPGLYGSYLIASAFTLAVDLWTRSLHAGAFALGRVYQPRWVMVAPDLLELALIVGLWPALGPFALGASLIATCLVRSTATLYYTRRAYRLRRLPWPRLMRLSTIARLELKDLRIAARGLLGSIPGQLDRVLLMALLTAPAGFERVVPIAAPYYALRPIAGVAQGWTRTYYVDLVRMEALATALFRHRLERLLRLVSAMAGALAGATLLAGAWLLFGLDGVRSALWLVPLCFMRSHFAALQIRAIAYARTDAMAALSAAMLGLVAFAQAMQLRDRELVAAVTVLLAVVGALTLLIERFVPRKPSRARKLAMGAWLAELCADRVPVRLHVAAISTKLARPTAVIHQLQSNPATERTTRLGRSWVLWWEHEDRALPRADLAALLGGTCDIHHVCGASNGMEALDRAREARWLPLELLQALGSPRDSVAARELRARFEREVPDGMWFDVEQASAGLATLPEGELAQIRRALLAETREQKIVPRRAPWQVAVYAPRGEPTLALVWRAHTPHTGELRRRVVQAGWRDSVPSR